MYFFDNCEDFGTEHISFRHVRQKLCSRIKLYVQISL